MSATLRRQLDRLQSDFKSIRPAPLLRCTLIGMPHGVTPQYKADLAQASKDFDMVIVLTPLAKARQSNGKVRFASN